jgi:hypothetical protein
MLLLSVEIDVFSALPRINAIQMKDSNGYGYPFNPVENYKSTG